eukprot:jgi/Bigna1/128089/aug1.5_g2797
MLGLQLQLCSWLLFLGFGCSKQNSGRNYGSSLSRSKDTSELYDSASIGDLYHTTEQIIKEALELTNSCSYLTVEQETLQNTTLPVFRLELQASSQEAKNENSNTNSSEIEGSLAEIDASMSSSQSQNREAKLNSLLIFGEHARELISPELGLAFVKYLCNNGNDKRVQRVLNSISFKIYPVVNVKGRAKIERDGKYCWRANGRGVDLNRNWDDHWIRTPIAAEGDDDREADNLKRDGTSGDSSFSESETMILRESVTQDPPDIFFTVHSGVLEDHLPQGLPSNVYEMLQVLQTNNQKYCRCANGPAGRELGYLCPGTCLDFVYDKVRTKYAFGLEIYDPNAALVVGVVE